MDEWSRITRFLRDPKTYPEGGPVEVRETHISFVTLTPRHAYKLMKPVRFDFLDFSTREARYRDCWRETRLNRRLAPGVYLGVMPITEQQGQLRLGGRGPCVDWLVKMKRLPDKATLESHIRSGSANAGDIDRLLDVLCPFFRKAATDREIAAAGRVEAVRANAVENLQTLEEAVAAEALPATAVQRLRSMQLQFLATRSSLFQQRVNGGWIRDGHGDLRAEHIYLTDPVVVVDCIEFNDRFRHVDTLDEICFLMTDLERLGRGDLAEQLLAEYRARMDDDAPDALVGFYRSYRLTVRAKVACLRAWEVAEANRAPLFEEARLLIDRAAEALEPYHRPWLIVFCGVSGMGKSAVAAPLAERLGAVRFASDIVRKELFGLAPLERVDDPRLYSPAANRQTYEELLRRGRAALQQGITVILDATFQRSEDRRKARQVADALGVAWLVVECRCPVELARERIRRRQRTGHDVSDADVRVMESQLERYQPPIQLPADRVLHLETTEPVETLVAQIVSRLAVV